MVGRIISRATHVKDMRREHNNYKYVIGGGGDSNWMDDGMNGVRNTL